MKSQSHPSFPNGLMHQGNGFQPFHELPWWSLEPLPVFAIFADGGGGVGWQTKHPRLTMQAKHTNQNRHDMHTRHTRVHQHTRHTRHTRQTRHTDSGFTRQPGTPSTPCTSRRTGTASTECIQASRHPGTSDPQSYSTQTKQPQEDSYCILCEVKREHCNFVRCIRYVHIRGCEPSIKSCCASNMRGHKIGRMSPLNRNASYRPV